MAKQKTYIAIDLKSFYASVECKERNRDPLTTNLVVADKSRTEKTICLAVSPSLKSYLTHSGIVKKIDEFERKLIMQDETVIPTEQISVIQGEMFKGLYE